MAEEVETSLLVIVVDLHTRQRYLRQQPSQMMHVLDSVVTLANMHLMLKTKNKVAIVGCNAARSDFIFCDTDAIQPQSSQGQSGNSTQRQSDGQYEVFAHLEAMVKQNMKKFSSDEKSGFFDDRDGESLIAGALTLSLCYINRINREKPTGEKLNSRLLIVTGCAGGASQHMAYMNVFFTAQKQNIVLDVCSLDYELGLLQQGCDITGGLFLKIPQLQGLLQYLLWVFLPEPPIRKKLVLPPPARVDYRAACFCHRNLIDIGFVCSICLSIFCKFSPICTTCNTVFKPPTSLVPKKKKKTNKSV
ncbi:General transcription factor IIH subunit 3 [Frankliniella fusca]|uniref:General transcription factor IIH subunit 3 n=1 Tax=Frankliniella fusca TaxID=407009 RepID=A0AAE1HJ88_9NEOP|nr:General transcription factor IIH subunit 3 [Frankliniella fusca]